MKTGWMLGILAASVAAWTPAGATTSGSRSRSPREAAAIIGNFFRNPSAEFGEFHDALEYALVNSGDENRDAITLVNNQVEAYRALKPEDIPQGAVGNAELDRHIKVIYALVNSDYLANRWERRKVIDELDNKIGALRQVRSRRPTEFAETEASTLVADTKAAQTLRSPAFPVEASAPDAVGPAAVETGLAKTAPEAAYASFIVSFAGDMPSSFKRALKSQAATAALPAAKVQAPAAAKRLRLEITPASASLGDAAELWLAAAREPSIELAPVNRKLAEEINRRFNLEGAPQEHRWLTNRIRVEPSDAVERLAQARKEDRRSGLKLVGAATLLMVGAVLGAPWVHPYEASAGAALLVLLLAPLAWLAMRYKPASRLPEGVARYPAGWGGGESTRISWAYGMDVPTWMISGTEKGKEIALYWNPAANDGAGGWQDFLQYQWSTKPGFAAPKLGWPTLDE